MRERKPGAVMERLGGKGRGGAGLEEEERERCREGEEGRGEVKGR